MLKKICKNCTHFIEFGSWRKGYTSLEGACEQDVPWVRTVQRNAPACKRFKEKEQI